MPLGPSFGCAPFLLSPLKQKMTATINTKPSPLHLYIHLLLSHSFNVPPKDKAPQLPRPLCVCICVYILYLCSLPQNKIIKQLLTHFHKILSVSFN